ncbi:hypothetical protein GYMLUDRAFT_252409 [Collybiopsis luxurians FD-317 M1]|uniref:T6SS Phospholipase effector Tle1-like catalytic domain-containing protein n=1 Tax=Collybiopsis luxurians FD-317 M1 TaxID=944289 RepID=A0A0D0BNI8_9AGAR|nr:hypothetical protein GYMLUDRAFT_252409 [Collybiopsis luxurians FD-317 M1]
MLVDSLKSIPPGHRYRTLILCFDDRAHKLSDNDSNVVEFFRLLKKDDSSEQQVYHQSGIGIYTPLNGTASQLMAKFSEVMDDAFGWYFQVHVMDAYEFLMQNYTAGDRICIFGVARGAYTACSLAGMIHKVGVLPAGNHKLVPRAYKMYLRNDAEGWKQSAAFKKAFSINVKIEFLGIWDTVSSAGIVPKRLPFTNFNSIVRTFRHAVALDECRAKFEADWRDHPNKQQDLNISSMPANLHRHLPDHDEEDLLNALERKSSEQNNTPTDILEVWFAGYHCDICGGSATKNTAPNLARIPLRWMIRECFTANSGILFYSNLLMDIGLNPSSLYPFVSPRPPSLPIGGNHIQCMPTTSSNASGAPEASYRYQTEEEMELADALSPVHDQLSLYWPWWLLELLPISTRYQLKEDSWTSRSGWNLGRGRVIRATKSAQIKIHRSVKMRLEARYADGSRYIPNARLDESYTIWVD